MLSSMQWTYAAGFWGLLGLVAPIVIHLLSRHTRKTVSMGTNRFLSASQTRQARSIRLSQPWTLFLRLMIVSVVAFTLMNPFIVTLVETSPRLYVHEKYRQPEYNSLLSAYGPEFEHRVFTFGKGNADYVYPNANALIYEANRYPDSVIIIAPQSASGFVDHIESIAGHVTWISPPSKRPTAISPPQRDLRFCLHGSTEDQRKRLSTLVKSVAESSDVSLHEDCTGYDILFLIDTVVATDKVTFTWLTDQVSTLWQNHHAKRYSFRGEISSQSLRASQLPLLLAGVLTEQAQTNHYINKAPIRKAKDDVTTLDPMEDSQKAEFSAVLLIFLLVLIVSERFLRMYRIR